jgi:hypothetical protein
MLLSKSTPISDLDILSYLLSSTPTLARYILYMLQQAAVYHPEATCTSAISVAQAWFAPAIGISVNFTHKKMSALLPFRFIHA